MCAFCNLQACRHTITSRSYSLRFESCAASYGQSWLGLQSLQLKESILKFERNVTHNEHQQASFFAWAWHQSGVSHECSAIHVQMQTATIGAVKALLGKQWQQEQSGLKTAMLNDSLALSHSMSRSRCSPLSL